MTSEKGVLSKSEAIRALRIVLDFQKECGDRAKWAVTYPVVRNSSGQNLKQVLVSEGFGDFRLVTESLEAMGWVKTHGWKGKSGVKGFVLRITEEGHKALAGSVSKGETKRTTQPDGKALTIEDILMTLMGLIRR